MKTHKDDGGHRVRFPMGVSRWRWFHDRPPPPHDHRREVTDRVIKLLEDGTAPSLKPWKDAPLHLPVDPTTGKNYRGGNVFGLLIDSMERGYTDPRFCTDT